nr:MAG TPA_asm: hypothetical protein [Caudoviricetes sp.]
MALIKNSFIKLKYKLIILKFSYVNIFYRKSSNIT